MENNKNPLKIAIVLFLFIGIMMVQAFNGEDLNNICTTNNSILFNNGTLWGCIDFTYLVNFNLPLWVKTVNYTNNTSCQTMYNITIYANSPNLTISNNIDNSLVAWYSLNDNINTTKVIDNLGVNNGTLVNAGNTSNVSVNGKINRAFGLDGVNDYVNVSSLSVNNYANISVGLWFKLNKNATELVLLSQRQFSNNQIELSVLSDNTTRFRVANGTNSSQAISSNKVYADGNWHYALGTYNNSKISLFVDNIYSTPISFTGAINTNSNIQIGQRTGGTLNFNGSIDDVRIYNRSLTADEILNIYNNTKYYYTGNLSGNIFTENNNGTIFKDFINNTLVNVNCTINNTYIFNGNINQSYGNFTTHDINATGTINAVENFSINGVKGLTINMTIVKSVDLIGLTKVMCDLNFSGGLLTSSTC